MTAAAVAVAYSGRLDLALRLADARAPLGRWLAAYVAAARGRFDRAVSIAVPLATASTDPPIGQRAAITAASALRQTHRHAEAVAFDALALRLARTPEQRAHALIGAAADAVGSGDARAAGRLLAHARAGADPWRARVRWHWVSAERALLDGDARAAGAHAAEARGVAARAGALRHEAKSLLFEGVALAEQRDARAAALLARAAAQATSIGATPIVRAASRVLEHHPGARERARRAG